MNRNKAAHFTFEYKKNNKKAVTINVTALLFYIQ